MAKNRRGAGERVHVVAAAGRTSGTPVIEQNLAGVPETDAATSARYALRIVGEYEVAFIASSVKGDRVDINLTTNALTRVAAGGAVANGTRPFATVTAVPGDGPTGDATQEPKTGKMWIKLLPQSVSWTA
jgi:predicted RecA/RadA family phage recombinase